MISPTLDTAEREMVILTIDPKGRWSRYRFEFCNALEDAMDMRDNARAIADLASLGVTLAPPDPASLASIIERVEAAQYQFERVPAAWNAFVKLRADILAIQAEKSGVKRVDEARKTEESRDVRAEVR